MFTLGTLFIRLICILPHLFIGQHFVYFLHHRILAADDPLLDPESVRTRLADKLMAFASFFKREQDSTTGTEQEHGVVSVSDVWSSRQTGAPSLRRTASSDFCEVRSL